MINAIKRDLRPVETAELRRITEMHGLFGTDHEGYAVLLEEVEELQDELKHIQRNLEALWILVKQDCTGRTKIDVADKIYRAAINAGCEAVQVAAVAEKFGCSIAERGKTDGMDD